MKFRLARPTCLAMVVAAFWPCLPRLAQAAPPSPDSAQIEAGKATQAESDFQRQVDNFEYSSRLSANTDIPIDQRLLIDYGGYISFNYLSADDPAQNTHILREEELTAYGMVSLDDAQEMFVRGHMSYRDYADGDTLAGGIEEGGQHTALDQLYYQFDLRKFLGAYDHKNINGDLLGRFGRQTVVWGNGLTFDENLDGIVADVTAGPVTVEAVAGVTVPDTIDFDTSRPGFNDRTARGFYGGMATVQVGQNQPYVYILSENDYNPSHTLLTTASGGELTTNFDYDGLYVGAGSKGNIGDHLVYGVEGTFESGHTLSNSYIVNGGIVVPVNQQTDPITAFAGDGRLDYVLGDTRNTHISDEVILASGNNDRFSTNDTLGGTKPGTRDLAYNGFGLLNTGVAFAPMVSNVLIERVGISTQPLNNITLFRKLEVGADVFYYAKFLERAPIDETSDSGRYLGWEPDVYINWQITSDLTFAMRYGSFFPGGPISKIDGPRSRQLFFTGLTFEF